MRTLKFGTAEGPFLVRIPIRATKTALIPSDVDENCIERWHTRVRQVSKVLAPRLRNRMLRTLIRDILGNVYLHRSSTSPFCDFNSLPRCTFDMIELCCCLSDPFEEGGSGWCELLNPWMELVRAPDPDGVAVKFSRTVVLLSNNTPTRLCLDVFNVPL